MRQAHFVLCSIVRVVTEHASFNNPESRTLAQAIGHIAVQKPPRPLLVVLAYRDNYMGSIGPFAEKNHLDEAGIASRKSIFATAQLPIKVITYKKRPSTKPDK